MFWRTAILLSIFVILKNILIFLVLLSMFLLICYLFVNVFLDNEMIPLSMTVSSGMFVFVSHCLV